MYLSKYMDQNMPQGLQFTCGRVKEDAIVGMLGWLDLWMEWSMQHLHIMMPVTEFYKLLQVWKHWKMWKIHFHSIWLLPFIERKSDPGQYLYNDEGANLYSHFLFKK